jgi:hypothetical protein
LLFSQSCKKNTENALLAPATESISAVLPPNVKVENNTLVIKDVEEYKQIRTFLDQSSTEEILHWQESIGFFSIRRWYEVAILENCCGDSPEVAPKYAGKVLFNTEDNTFAPKQHIPHLDWLVNDKGGYFVANTLIYFRGDSIFSIKDESHSLIHAVHFDPFKSPEIILDAHAYGIGIKPNSVQERGCTQNLQGTAPIAYQNTPQANGNHRVLDSSHSILDYSTVLVRSGLPNSNVFDFVSSKYAKHQRKTALGWTVCERTTWTIAAEYVLTHNIPVTFGPPTNPLTETIGWTTNVEQCEWNHRSQVIFFTIPGNNPSPARTAWNNRFLTYGNVELRVIPQDGCGLNIFFGCS